MTHLDLVPDPNQVPRRVHSHEGPLDGLNLAGGGGGGSCSGIVNATTGMNGRALQSHHSSTVQMLENALTAVRNDASQLPLSDLVHASTMIRDLESVLRERLGVSIGDDEGPGVSGGATIERERPARQ